MATDALRKAIDTFSDFMAALEGKTNDQAAQRATAPPTIKLAPNNTTKGQRP